MYAPIMPKPSTVMLFGGSSFVVVVVVVIVSFLRFKIHAPSRSLPCNAQRQHQCCCFVPITSARINTMPAWKAEGKNVARGDSCRREKCQNDQSICLKYSSCRHGACDESLQHPASSEARTSSQSISTMVMRSSLVRLARTMTPRSRVIDGLLVNRFPLVNACAFSTVSTTMRHLSLSNGVTATSNDNTNNTKTSPRPTPIRNEALAQVKAMGMSHLEATTLEIQSKTRAPLFLHESEMGPTPDQLAEANRIYTVTTKVLETFSQRDTTFSIKGEPIVIMEVEVSQDLRQARVYWALPFSVMNYPSEILEQVTERMQHLLEKRGGKLQRLVHAQLRSYYPPKLRFVPSPDSVFQQDIQNMASSRKSKSRRRR